MVQMRLMGDDEDRVREVAAVVIEVLRSSGHVLVGDPADLGMRGPGARIVVEVFLPGMSGGEARPVRVRAERADQDRPRRRVAGGRRALE